MMTDLSIILDRIDLVLTTRAQLLMQDNTQPTRLTEALLDAVALFESLGIRYALIGGFAAMIYGRPRVTEDVDFIAEPGHEDVLSRNPEVMRRHHFDPGCTFKLYHDSGAEIDIWKDQHVAGALDHVKASTLLGRSICVVDPHDLIAMKLRADRPQDMYDVAEILKHTPVDEETVRERVTLREFERFSELRRRYHL